MLKQRGQFEAAASRPLVPREQFIAQVHHACASQTGFAAAKLGISERAWLLYPLLLEREGDERRRRAFELVLAYKSLQQSGIVPADAAFYGRWAERYVSDLAEIDSIGVLEQFLNETFDLLAYHGLDVRRTTDWKVHEPDRSTPGHEKRCYLGAFRDRNVLLVGPFAGFLAERATEKTSEAVWARTGKPWFAPRSVEALEFSYGFSRDTQARYGTSLDLLKELDGQLAERSFDVALIAAGGMGIPLAASVKRRGTVAVSLGGHLQVLLGVLGERWRTNPTRHERYFNEAWVALPERYATAAGASGENYW